ncbi:energy-coupling factor transporter transmembrane protein EcfT [uncultured Microbacterium sp.]|uniref:energy-coupling factor transporter transmembrane component T family protein n=1 Tax=uncultured Microbacterium sp. TaxID=191216 RepID=UPI0025F9349F|nr:energy-coupling factor transporter transmembrane component T [uncultured Microbacterium sp.]
MTATDARETQAPPAETLAIDPYAPGPPASAWRFLHHLNPLAKFVAPVPAMLLLIFTRDLLTPALFLALAYVVMLAGARLDRRAAAAFFGILPLFALATGLGFSIWTDATRVAGTPVVLQLGEWRLHTGALAIGFATALRLTSIVALTLIGGLTSTGQDLARALVQNLRVPYRIGYTAIAAFRFVPRFRHELELIRQAHRVRGVRSGPLAAVIPLLAGAIRHAERVALAMDARAFGAYPTRTERHLVPFRLRDVVFVALFWIVSAALLWWTYPWGA